MAAARLVLPNPHSYENGKCSILANDNVEIAKLAEIPPSKLPAIHCLQLVIHGTINYDKINSPNNYIIVMNIVLSVYFGTSYESDMFFLTGRGLLQEPHLSSVGFVF